MNGTAFRRVFVHGRVQGVSYRDWAVRAARSLGLDGWVRNRLDGRVEMIVAGPPDAVEAMIAQCREGPRLARVDRVEVEETNEAVIAGFVQMPTL
ncbi:MAG: acylphosphatase [Sphingomonas sp.]|nr:acylphosphatase [Sphingomonas sp.]